MCGIVAYTGYKPASPILLDGLSSLEYRGYDSAGMYLAGRGPYRTVGRVQTLADLLDDDDLTSMSGIAHTRWATHGQPSTKNTHPHCDQTGKIWIVHNGMIDNFHELKEELLQEGHEFYSETDTEVLAHLIANAYEKEHTLEDAITTALGKVEGTYGLVAMHIDNPEKIVTASLGSPIYIGLKKGEHIIASDTAVMFRHTSNIVTLNDGEYAVVTPKEYSIYSFDHKIQRRKPKILNLGFENSKKFDTHMIKDISEIPSVLENGARGRIVISEGNAKFKGMEAFVDELRNISRLIIVGCGSSYFAGLVGKLLFEDFTNIPVKIEYGSEFSTRPIIASHENTFLLVLSESGETPEVVASVREAKKIGMRTMGIVNVVGSTIAKKVDMCIYNHAGPERGVVTTKSFVSQLEVLSLVALYIGRLRGLTQARGAELAMEVLSLPEKMREILAKQAKIKKLAENYLGYDDFLFVGREYNIATAHEGALKLKKVSYIHAESHPSGEVKHGPIAMLNDIFPTVAIMPSDSVYEYMKKDVLELKERKGPLICVATEGNKEVTSFCDDVIYIPDTKECLTPILANVPLQLFAYYTGELRGFNTEPNRRPSKLKFVEEDYH